MADIYDDIVRVSSPYHEFNSAKTPALAKKLMKFSKKVQKDIADLSREVEILAKKIK